MPKSRQKKKGVITSTNGPRGDTTVDICTRWKKIKLSQGTSEYRCVKNIYDSEETKCVSISLFVHLQRGLKAWMFVSTTEEVAILSSKIRFS